MKLTEQARNIAVELSKQFIKAQEASGKKVDYSALDSIVEHALQFSTFEFDEEDKSKIVAQIEYECHVGHSDGFCIFDDYDDTNNWYSNEDITDPFYWKHYRRYLSDKSSIDENSIKLLDEKTLPDIMNCLGNPNDDLESQRVRRGLIIGDVQSGKTATYSGLICKAADAGYKVVILLAGITENLRKQTQERIDAGIVGVTLKKVGKQEVLEKVGVGEYHAPIATSFTSSLKDFTSNSSNIAASLQSQNSLVVFVIKKNVSVLKRLHKWLKDLNVDHQTGLINEPMLLIDDEADNASVNTRKDETDPTQTNKLIRKICYLFKNSTYVGFTATPFANVFIDPDSVDAMKKADLFPEHFIYALPTPTSYIGAQRIFYPEGDCYHNLRYINDIEEPDYTSDEYKDAVKNDVESLNEGPFYFRHTKDWDGEYPESLRESILSFFLANVIRDLRGNKSAPRSMLINMSRFVKMHRRIADHVTEIRNAVYADIDYNFSDDDNKNMRLPLYQELKRVWEKHYSHVTDITFDRVIKKENLTAAISPIQVMVVNGGKSSGKLDYSANKSLRVIAVGGIALSRGLTLEGLLTSYFYRNTATFDVLMQMGRWFGYRFGYEDIFQIWTSASSAEWYAEIARASEELKNDIKTMFEQHLTPKDFGLRVRNNCEELQITAANKMRASFDLDKPFSYYGGIYETPYVSLNTEQNTGNLNAVKWLSNYLFAAGCNFRFANIGKFEDSEINNPAIGASRYFENIPKRVVIDFLSKIKCSLVNTHFNVENLTDFITSPDTDGVDKWDVVFVGGESAKHYDIHGLENIKLSKRTIYCENKRVIQITSRRRVLSAGGGLLTLTKEQQAEAQKAQREAWVVSGVSEADATTRSIPARAYFERLPHRKPMLAIILIDPQTDLDADTEKLKEFRENLGEEPIVAFAVGFPGVHDNGKSRRYKVNKIFYQLNMMDEIDMEEEIDEE